MKNYLFVRHEMFNQISKKLIQEEDYTIFLSFEFNDFFMNKDYSEKIYVPFKIFKGKSYNVSKTELLKLDFLELALKKNNKDKIIKKYKKYLWAIDRIFDNKKIDEIFIYNGSNWVEQLIIFIAKKNNIRVNYLEEGYFRPYTVTMDHSGINFKSSIPREKYFYKNIKVDEKFYRKYLLQPQNKELSNVKSKNIFLIKGLKKLSTKIFGSLKIQPQIYIHNTIKDYISIFYNGLKYKKLKNEDISNYKRYIFVPFQVHTDTQILFNSPKIRNMEELVEVVVNAIKNYNKKYKDNLSVVFKEHPKDIGRINYSKLYSKFKNKNVIFLKKANTNDLIKNAELIITVNSTVGIEALIKEKKVVTLGNAFFNIEDLVIYCENPHDLQKKIKESLDSKFDKFLSKQFLYYLRFIYNFEGSWKGENKIIVNNIIMRLKK